MRIVFIGFLAALLSFTTLADEDDHRRSRAAMMAGEILPLRTILDKVETQVSGQVLEVELERSKGMWIYEMKLLRSDNHLVELLVNAKTGEVLGDKVRTPKRRMKGEHADFNR